MSNINNIKVKLLSWLVITGIKNAFEEGDKI
jgi:hypothetical protein